MSWPHQVEKCPGPRDRTLLADQGSGSGLPVSGKDVRVTDTNRSATSGDTLSLSQACPDILAVLAPLRHSPSGEASKCPREPLAQLVTVYFQWNFGGVL